MEQGMCLLLLAIACSLYACSLVCNVHHSDNDSTLIAQMYIYSMNKLEYELRPVLTFFVRIVLRWQIYSESDEVNTVQMDIRDGHGQTVSKVTALDSNRSEMLVRA
jgi:hypothetical protein